MSTDNVKVVLRLRPSTSSDTAWAVTGDTPPLLQQTDLHGNPTTTYGLGEWGIPLAISPSLLLP